MPLRTPFDLHVLGTPPAFILSQDQTLHNIREFLTSCDVVSFFSSYSFLTSLPVTLQLLRCAGSPTRRLATKIPMPSHLCSDIGCLRRRFFGYGSPFSLVMDLHFCETLIVLSVFYYTHPARFVKGNSPFSFLANFRGVWLFGCEAAVRPAQRG